MGVFTDMRLAVGVSGVQVKVSGEPFLNVRFTVSDGPTQGRVDSRTTDTAPRKVNVMSQTYAPTVLAVAMLIAAIAVAAGNWLLVIGVLSALLAGARLARHHPSRRQRR